MPVQELCFVPTRWECKCRELFQRALLGMRVRCQQSRKKRRVNKGVCIRNQEVPGKREDMQFTLLMGWRSVAASGGAETGRCGRGRFF